MGNTASGENDDDTSSSNAPREAASTTASTTASIEPTNDTFLTPLDPPTLVALQQPNTNVNDSMMMNPLFLDASDAYEDSLSNGSGVSSVRDNSTPPAKESLVGPKDNRTAQEHHQTPIHDPHDDPPNPSNPTSKYTPGEETWEDGQMPQTRYYLRAYAVFRLASLSKEVEVSEDHIRRVAFHSYYMTDTSQRMLYAMADLTRLRRWWYDERRRGATDLVPFLEASWTDMLHGLRRAPTSVLLAPSPSSVEGSGSSPRRQVSSPPPLRPLQHTPIL